ncbi:MAG: thiamine pyrophosphate-binding protein, partial [Thaumarchaeota archaeon]|nr:thiamine pyrophosphate-binding protein [Nitrososphaerota archaeon]
MKKIEAIKIISSSLPDTLLVANIGVTSMQLFDADDKPRNFYML